mgnify:CR=1 FL=1
MEFQGAIWVESAAEMLSRIDRMSAALGLLAHVTRAVTGGLSWFGAMCVALGFTVVMRLVWQFQLYLRTDLYYVFATALRCHDLHDASVGLLRNRLWRLLGRPDRLVDEDRWTGHDRRAGRWYGPFVVLGVGVMLALTVFGSLPIVLTYAEIVGRNLTGGHYDLYFWDAVVSLAINVGQLVLVAHLARRKRRTASPARTPEGERV